MKYLYPLALVILLLTASCNSNKPMLKVTISNVEDGIAFLHDTRDFITDTIIINKGVLVCDKSITSPAVFELWIAGFNEFPRAFRLVLSQEPTEVHFDDLRPNKIGQLFGFPVQIIA